MRIILITKRGKQKRAGIQQLKRKDEFLHHQNQMLRLSTTFAEVDTKGIRPNSATNRLTHWVLLSL